MIQARRRRPRVGAPGVDVAYCRTCATRTVACREREIPALEALRTEPEGLQQGNDIRKRGRSRRLRDGCRTEESDQGLSPIRPYPHADAPARRGIEILRCERDEALI